MNDLLTNYSYEIDEEGNGLFSMKGNPRCKINFSVEDGEEYDRLKIELFQCFPQSGSAATAAGVPRSNGNGRTMLLHLLRHMKTRFPNIRTVCLEAEPFPDPENVSEEQYKEYYSKEKLPLNELILKQYYNTLGFTHDVDNWLEGHIDHIIHSIENYDNMKLFNADISPEIERQMLEDFSIATTSNHMKSKKKKGVNRKTGNKISSKKKSSKKKSNKKRRK